MLLIFEIRGILFKDINIFILDDYLFVLYKVKNILDAYNILLITLDAYNLCL